MIFHQRRLAFFARLQVSFCLCLLALLFLLPQTTSALQRRPAPSAPAFAAQGSQTNVADQLLAEAEKLRTAATPASRREAVEKYKAALLLWQSLGDRRKEATTRNGLCSVYNRLGERQVALGYCEQAVVLRRELKDQAGEAETLNLIGNIQLALHGPLAALDYFQRSLALRRALGDRRGIVVTLGNLSGLYSQTGEAEKELEALREALPSAQALNDKALEMELLNRLGNGHSRLGPMESAFGYYQQAIVLSRALNDKWQEASTLTNLGGLYQETGNMQQALDALAAAVALYREIGDQAATTVPLINLAGVWNALGEAGKALLIGEEGLKLAKESGAADYEFFALQTLSDTHHMLGNNRKALEYRQAALALARARNNKSGEASALSRLALDNQRLNDLLKALEYGQQAIALHRATGDRLELMYALHELCRAYHKLSDYSSAVTACRESLELARLRGDRVSEARSLVELARIAAHNGEMKQARDCAEEGVKLVETAGSEFVNREARASFIGVNYQAYESYIGILMKQHRDNSSAALDRQALQMAERAHARVLLTSLAEARVGIRQGVEAALLEREQRVLKQLKMKAIEQNRLSEANANRDKAASVAREITELSAELERVRGQIRTDNPHYAALIQPQSLSSSQIQKEVVASHDTLLLEYALGEEQSFLWAISANSFNSYELDKGEIIEKAAQRVYDLLTARNLKIDFEDEEERRVRIKKADAEFQIAAAELSRLILAPAAKELRSKRPKQLLIVADGKLQYVPFAALPVIGDRLAVVGKNSRTNRPPTTGYRPLILDYEIVNLPSASTLAVLRRELKDRKPAPKTLAVFADPVFEADDERVPKDVRDRLARERQTPATKEKSAEAAIATDELTRAIRNVGLDGERAGLQRLPFSREEANAILKFAPQDGSFGALDFDATQEAALKPELGQYRYVHFATHGFMDNTTPELSGLVLSLLDSEGRKRDGFLRMVEIYNLNLPAELVVLSACKTGLGKEVRGEGLMSLTRGFMYAGARRVVVSLWDVNDKSTASLMSELYRGLLTQKLRPSAALRAAQLKLFRSRQWNAPYYWAAFAQHGEPR